MPATDDLCSSCDGVASSKSGEGVIRCVCSVLEYDVMLGLGTELRHAVDVREGEEKSESEGDAECAWAASVDVHSQQPN
jgi:hypothetical protein